MKQSKTMKLPPHLEAKILATPGATVSLAVDHIPETKKKVCMELKLPYPPSVNHYYRHVGHRTLISRKGREYRQAVAEAVMLQRGSKRLAGPIAVDITVWPPDKRRRDLDNLCKGLLDSLQHAGVYLDDSQIERLTIERMLVATGGSVIVTIQNWL